MADLSLKELTAKSARDILVRPIITEKSVENAAFNKFTFEVKPDANKIEIRKAVEEVFRVTVTKVTTSSVKGKRRMRYNKHGRNIGFTKSWKKAVVTLKEGDTIEIGGFNPFEM